MDNYFSRINKIIVDKTGGNVSEFARKANIPRGTIQAYLKKKMPDPIHLVSIQKAFNVNLNWLLANRGTPYDVDDSLLWDIIEETELWMHKNERTFDPLHKIEILEQIYDDHFEKGIKPTAESVEKILRLIK